MVMKAGRPTGRTTKHVAKSATQLDELKRLNILLPASELRALKVYAAQHDTTVTSIIRNSIKPYVKR